MNKVFAISVMIVYQNIARQPVGMHHVAMLCYASFLESCVPVARNLADISDIQWRTNYDYPDDFTCVKTINIANHVANADTFILGETYREEYNLHDTRDNRSSPSHSS